MCRVFTCDVVRPGHFVFLFAAVSKDVLSIFFMLLLYRSLGPIPIHPSVLCVHAWGQVVPVLDGTGL